MCLLILAIGIAMIIGGVVIYGCTCAEGAGVAVGVIGAIISVVAAIALIFLMVSCASASTVDARIEMYQEENVKIEEQIAAVVKQYQEYEKEIFMEVSPESAMTLVALYPELKADSLVASQIDIYVANNEKIKELKEESINASVIRWWTYFGG